MSFVMLYAYATGADDRMQPAEAGAARADRAVHEPFLSPLEVGPRRSGMTNLRVWGSCAAPWRGSRVSRHGRGLGWATTIFVP